MKTPEPFRVSRPQFIGEQDGPPERKLKSRLVELFTQEHSIQKAFLVRVAYGGSAANSVAICLCAAITDEDIMERIGNIFGSIFRGREHLDIMFVTEAQEVELKRCCKPFFDSDAGCASP